LPLPASDPAKRKIAPVTLKALRKKFKTGQGPPRFFDGAEALNHLSYLNFRRMLLIEAKNDIAQFFVSFLENLLNFQALAA
jgi:hypothetical protein